MIADSDYIGSWQAGGIQVLRIVFIGCGLSPAGRRQPWRFRRPAQMPVAWTAGPAAAAGACEQSP
jgi:hypothetical protein